MTSTSIRTGLALAAVLTAACGGGDGSGRDGFSSGGQGGGSGGDPGTGGTGAVAAGGAGVGGAGAVGGTGGAGGGMGGAGGAPPAGCGNGVIDANEHCDDGNNAGYDGCDPTCRYEAMYRLTRMNIVKGATPAFCPGSPANALGAAIADPGLQALNQGFADAIGVGTGNILTYLIALDDLTGANDMAFDMALTSGVPDPARGAWPGNDPIDWSFLLDPATLGPDGLPTARLGAASSGGVITGGPGSASLGLSANGVTTRLEMVNAAVHARFAPATSVPAPPPAMLAPGLVVADIIEAIAPDQGICGGTTVESLAQIPVTADIAVGGATACSEGYRACPSGVVDAACNSLLDVLVSGCTVLLVPGIVPTQPDVLNGGPAPLTAGPDRKVPPAQTMGNKNAYTTFVQFTAVRAHATGVQ